MLTLSKPIKLNSVGGGILTISDSFVERMLANYGLMAAQFGPKELLHLLALPPEAPEPQGGAQVFSNTSIESSRNVMIDVVNNVVNRILLDGRSDFTYQDQVYITTVLSKLGITNVAEFMRQVRTLRTESTSVAELLSSYHSNFMLLRQIVARGEESRRRESEYKTPDERALDAESLRYYIHGEIYSRLRTAEIYRAVHELSRERALEFYTLDTHELRQGDSLRISNLLALSDIKQRVQFSESLALTHHINHYETGTLLPFPENERQVLEQGAAAMLLSVADNLLVTRIDRYTKGGDVWVDIKRALYQSGENSIARFEHYHGAQGGRVLTERYSERLALLYRQERAAFEHMMTETRAERERLTLVLAEQTQTGEPQQAPESGSTAAELIERISRTGDMYAHTLQRINIAQTYLEYYDGAPQTLVTEQLRRLIERGDIVPDIRETLARHLLPAPPEGKASGAQPQPSALEHAARAAQHEAALHADMLLTERAIHESVSLQLRAQGIEPLSPPRARRAQTESQPPASRERPHELPSEPPQQPAPFIHFEAQPDAGQAEDGQPPMTERERMLLVQQQLEQINRRNLEAYERIKERQVEQISEARPPRPDRRRIIADALKAVESPEQLIEQLKAAPPPMEHPDAPSPLDPLLSEVDATTRGILETVIEYQRDPQAAVESGRVKQGTVGTLNADILDIQREASELTHLTERVSSESEVEREATEHVIERLREYTIAASPGQTGADTPPRVPIIHRRTTTELSEETLREFEQRRRAEVREVHTVESVSTETVRHIDQNSIVQDVVARTTEDLTEIVNRTLARQMGTISEQVYGQIERRLQTERARRGAF